MIQKLSISLNRRSGLSLKRSESDKKENVKMKIRIIKTLVIALMTIGFCSHVMAGTWMDYNETQFKQSQAKGETIVLDFYAAWCGSCTTQKEVLKELVTEADFKKLAVFIVSYDESDDLKTKLGVDSQGTLIVYKGDKEVGRGYGIIGKNEIKTLVAKGL